MSTHVRSPTYAIPNFFLNFQNSHFETALRITKTTVSEERVNGFFKNVISIAYVLLTGFPQALELMENRENHEKKYHAWKNHGIKKKLNNYGKIMHFCEII